MEEMMQDFFLAGFRRQVAGVDKSGSNLFSTFSPTMLYDAIPAGATLAKIMNQKLNALNRGTISE